jgi:tRNA(Ile)-lysidine synthase
MASSSISLSKRPVLARRAGFPALLRPLLHCSRKEILDYAAAHGLQWIEDESNSNDSYPRNFLRHRVMPLLEQHFPAYRDTLGRSAQHFAEANDLLDELANQDAGQAMDGNAMRLAALRELSPARAKNLLRYFLHAQGAPMPQSVHLEEMLRQLCDARQDAAVDIRCGDHQIRRYRDKVYLLPAATGFDHDFALSWQGEAILEWPPLATRLHFSRTTGAGVSLQKLQRAPLTLRLRKGSETLRPHPAAAKRTLKNLLQQFHIPPWQRERLPLLYCGEELVCVAGLAIDAEYQALENEDGVLVSCE